MNIVKLFEIIKESVIEIDTDLKSINQTGIFFAPELYISFIISKSILKNSEIIFDRQPVIWKRESMEYQSGIADMIFESSDEKIVIELKLKSKINQYLADVRKLGSLPDNCMKLFCVLVDSFNPIYDKRIEELESYDEVSKLGAYSFETWSGQYKTKPFYCIIGLYLIK